MPWFHGLYIDSVYDFLGAVLNCILPTHTQVPRTPREKGNPYLSFVPFVVTSPALPLGLVVPCLTQWPLGQCYNLAPPLISGWSLLCPQRVSAAPSCSSSAPHTLASPYSAGDSCSDKPPCSEICRPAVAWSLFYTHKEACARPT